MHLNKNLEDSALLARYRAQGNSEYLGLLYDRYLPLIYGVCLKYLKSREASQDAVMDIYEHISVKLLDQEVAYFKSWIYMVSKNHCLMLLRKKEKSISFNELFMDSAQALHHDSGHQLEEDLQALEACIEQLKESQRKCVKMFFLEQKSYAEIERLSTFKMSKVKSYIQNGKRNLKICLESRNVEK